jgi:hypothetical protein
LPIQFGAGQRLTADALQALAPKVITQGTQQDVISSVTLIDTAIVVPVADRTEIRLDLRHSAGGGGIRWAWRSAGTITTLLRSILSPGAPTTGSNFDIGEMRFRSIATPGEVQTVPQYQSGSTNVIWETLLVEGSGDLIFQFAQETSNAGATSINANAHAVYSRLAVL